MVNIENNAAATNQLEINNPILINKAIITPAILKEIEEMQSYGKADGKKPIYDNEGVQLHIKSIDEVISYLISKVANCSIGEVKHK